MTFNRDQYIRDRAITDADRLFVRRFFEIALIEVSDTGNVLEMEPIIASIVGFILANRNLRRMMDENALDKELDPVGGGDMIEVKGGRDDHLDNPP